MAGIHGIELTDDDRAFLDIDAPGDTALRRHVEDQKAYHQWVTGGDLHPVITATFDWLEANWPADDTDAYLSWGDGRVGNVMYRDFEPVGVLDWEMAGVGAARGRPGVDDLHPPLLRGHRRHARAAGHARTSCARTTCAPPTRRSPGYAPRDMQWYLVYAALRHGIVMCAGHPAGGRVRRGRDARGPRRPHHAQADALRHARRHLLGQDAVTVPSAPATVPNGGGHPDDELHAAHHRRPVVVRDVLVHLHGARAEPVGAVLPLLPGQPRRGRRAARTSGTPRATRRRRAATPRTSGTCPFPTTPLTDLQLANGLRYRCVRPGSSGSCPTTIPDGDEIHVELTFTVRWRRRTACSSRTSTNPVAYEGTIVLHGETIDVDSFGFRDRSWGLRSQFGPGPPRLGAPTAAATATPPRRRPTASTPSPWTGARLHEPARLPAPRRRRGRSWRRPTRVVTERDADGYPVSSPSTAPTSSGASSTPSADAATASPSSSTRTSSRVNCLTEWTFDGVTAWGEDHDNWTGGHPRPPRRRTPSALSPTTGVRCGDDGVARRPRWRPDEHEEPDGAHDRPVRARRRL